MCIAAFRGYLAVVEALVQKHADPTLGRVVGQSKQRRKRRRRRRRNTYPPPSILRICSLEDIAGLLLHLPS